MNEHLQEISNKQKISWNKFSPGWKKWRSLLNDQMQPASDGIIQFLQPGGRQIILDIASGTGEPGLSIAALLTDGKVVLTDLAGDMLHYANEIAKNKNISNAECKVCDVSALPFDDNRFDAVSCRMGFMFFPDMLLAAKEIRRVLKPGGKFATTVWSTPEKNTWVTDIGDCIKINLQLPDPVPGAPGIFRCAKPGLMSNIFNDAGFKNIGEKEIPCKLNFSTAKNYWDMMTEIAAPIVGALSKADDSMITTIKNEVYQIINDKYPNQEVIINGSCLLLHGEK
ncbi:MAG: methyltransferase domain-containing protein [Bacteroidetes bacterium]|nr:methyltransferase domain-containing protein [Bacteroidota bacterium]MBS1757954.1 methyltransferase domain-containing protein [Bacteroidota bacterium]